MGLEIRFVTSELDNRELNALAALIHSLGGRAPSIVVAASGPAITNDRVEIEPKTVTKPVDVPPPPTTAAPTPSEALMAAEAARVVPLPPSNDVPPPPPAGVDLDARGFPHDLRIHASTKTKKGDDTWTYKRGLQTDDAGKALIAQVEAELRQTMGAPVPSGDVPPPPAHTDPATAFATVPSDNVPPPPADTVVPPPPATDDAAISEFSRIMRVVLAKQAAGTLSTERVTEIAASIGLPGMKNLRDRPDLIPAFEALLS